MNPHMKFKLRPRVAEATGVKLRKPEPPIGEEEEIQHKDRLEKIHSKVVDAFDEFESIFKSMKKGRQRDLMLAILNGLEEIVIRMAVESIEENLEE